MLRTERRKGALDRLVAQLSAGTKPEKVLDEKTKQRISTGQIVALTDSDKARIKAEISTLKLSIEKG